MPLPVPRVAFKLDAADRFGRETAPVQRSTSQTGGAPASVTLTLAGRPIVVRIPPGADKRVLVALDEHIGGAHLTGATLDLDDAWKVKRGTVTAAADFSVAGVDCHSDLALSVANGGRVKSGATGTLEAGPLTGRAALSVSAEGASGTVDFAVREPVSLAVAGGIVQIDPGSAGSATMVQGNLGRIELKSLMASVSDGSGPLVAVQGKGHFAPATGFSAQGKATLARDLRTSLGGFALTLAQGDAQGTVALNGAAIESLTADFGVAVDHASRGRLGVGRFSGRVTGTGDKVLGKGTFTLGPGGLAFGDRAGFHVVAAAEGSQIGVDVEAGGQPRLLLDVESHVNLGEKWLAKGKAKKVVYDGHSLTGEFDLRLNVNFSFRIGALTTRVSSNGNLGLAVVGDEVTLDGGDLRVDFEWNGKPFRLSWPKFRISGGSLGPLPSLELPSFDLSGLLAWLKGLLPSGFSLDWLFRLFERLSLKLPSLGGFPDFLAWFKGFRLPWPDLPLIGWPDFEWPSLFRDLWEAFLAFLANLRTSFALPDLSGLLSGLDIPGFDLDWFKGWFGGGGGLSLETDGKVDLVLAGAALPRFEAIGLRATLLSHGQKLATLAAPNMSYDGQTFTAWADLIFEKGLGPSFGDYRVALDKAGVSITLTAGQPRKLTITALDVSLHKAGQKLGTGTLANLVIDEEGGVSFDDAAIGVVLARSMPLGGQAGYAFSLRPGTSVTVGLRSGEIGWLGGENVGIDVDRDGKPLARGTIPQLRWDVAAGIEQASADLELLAPIQPVDGVVLRKGRAAATIVANALTTLSLAGVEVDFRKSVGGQRLALSGVVTSGTYDASSQTLRDLDATLALAVPIAVGSDKTRVALRSGALRLIVAGGAFQCLEFENLALSATVGRLSLDGSASGALTERGLTLSRSQVALKRAVAFGDEGRSFELHEGATAALRLTDSVVESVELDTDVTVHAGPIQATGSIAGSYDGHTIGSASGSVKLSKAIAVGTPELGGTLAAGATARVAIAQGQLSEVALGGVAFEAHVQGVRFAGVIQRGAWKDGALSFGLDLGVSTSVPLKLGRFSLQPTGGRIHIHVVNGNLTRVDVGGLLLRAGYEPDEGAPVWLDLAMLDGAWDTTGLSGRASAELVPGAVLAIGPPSARVVIRSGRAEVGVSRGSLTTLSVAGLKGVLVRNGVELASVTVGSGTYDFATGAVTQAQLSFAMQKGQVLSAGKGIAVHDLAGSLALGDETLELSAQGALDAVFGEGSPAPKAFSGKAKVCWKQVGEGEGDFAGTSADIAGVLIDNPNQGRHLGGEAALSMAAGNVPTVTAVLDFALADGIGGKVDLTALPSSDGLEPVVGKGRLAFSKALLKAKRLIDLDLERLSPGVTPKPGGAVSFGLGGGVGLALRDLVAGGGIELTEPWKPLEGEVPRFESPVQLSWGLSFNAELFGILEVLVPFFWGLVEAGASLKGGIATGLDLDVAPLLTLKGDGNELTTSFDLNLRIAPKADLILAMSFLLGLDVPLFKPIRMPFDIGRETIGLGTLFDILVSTGVDVGESGPRPRAPKTPQQTQAPAIPAADFGSPPKGSARTNQVDAGGSSEGLLAGAGPMGSAKGEAGGMSGLGSLMAKAKLVGDVARGVQALGILLDKIIDGVTAFFVAGPFGLAAWGFWQLITGGIGEIEDAISNFGASASALTELVGEELYTNPDMDWLRIALGILDSEADDKARARVDAGEHRGQPAKYQALLIMAMYAGSCGDDDEQRILQVMRDAPDLGALLVAVSGELKAGVDEALYNLDHAENTQLRELLWERQLGHLIEMADDVYARWIVEQGKHPELNPTQRGKLVGMLASGSCGDDDEAALVRIVRASVSRGDLESVFRGAGWDSAKAVTLLLHQVDGAEHDELVGLLRQAGLIEEDSG